MGTRGTIGVRVDGEDKLAYNHSDSYPEYLGVKIWGDITSMLGDWGIEKMREQARKLTLVDNDTPPMPGQIADLVEFTNLSVSEQNTNDWYCVLRELQGELAKYLEVGYMEGDNTFIYDSLFCEWGYIANLDDEVLEIYRGFQKTPHDKGRYADGRDIPGMCDGYYPSALILTIPFAELPETEQELLVAIHLAPFESIEEAVIDRLQDYGELSIDEAKSQFGLDVDQLLEVIDSIKDAGYKVDFDGELYTV